MNQMKKTAIFLIDVQRDFCAGGTLAVPNGDEVVPVCNKLIEAASLHGMPVLASRDAHPQNHCSFKESGGIWPVHCVDGQPGSEFYPDLKLPADAIIFKKGTSPDADAYSGFDGTGAAKVLREANIERLLICGLATDYCVKASVLDALKNGFEAVVLSDGCRAVNVQPDDGDKAFAEMQAAGATVIPLSEVQFE